MLLALASVALAGSHSLLVRVEPGVRPDFEGAGAVGVACFASSNVCVVDAVTVEEVRALRGVRSVEHDRSMRAASGPSIEATAACPDPYELDAIGVADVWSTVCGAGAPVVAVQDAGFRSTHVDLAGRVVEGWDYGDNDDRPEVTFSAAVPEHGTFVAGIVAANHSDGVGRTGVAPEASLFLQKIADSSGSLFFSYAIAAMDDLASAHPEVGVLNYSIASTNPPAAFEDAIAALETADILLVTAAANCNVPNCAEADNDQDPVYPANYPHPHVVAVASQQADGALDPFSHYGATTVDLAAPGADLCSLGATADDEWLIASGTSYATPVVAAAGALVREAWPRLTAPEVARVLCSSADPTPALATRVACGALRIDQALVTPVALWLEVPDLVVDGTTSWTVVLDSRAAAGEATLQFSLPEGVTLVGGNVVAIPLAADGPTEVTLQVEADRDVVGPGTVTLILATSDAEAVSFDVVATAQPASTTEIGTTEPSESTSRDAGAAGPGCGCTVPGTRTTHVHSRCVVRVPGTGSWPLAAALLLLLRRRRPRG